jgi:hypothetical protein
MQLYTLQRVEEFERLVKGFLKRRGGVTADDVTFLLRLLQKDVKTRACAACVLPALHARANERFKRASNLANVVNSIVDGSIDAVADVQSDATGDGDGDGDSDVDSKYGSSASANGERDDDGAVRALLARIKPDEPGKGMVLGTPVKPQLCAAVKSYELAVKKCEKEGGGLFAEVKYDGERVQVGCSQSRSLLSITTYFTCLAFATKHSLFIHSLPYLNGERVQVGSISHLASVNHYLPCLCN